MANNGLLVNGVCSSVDLYVVDLVSKSSSCVGRYPVYYPKDLNIACQGSTWISLGPRPAYNCEISGPPLTELQQIEAIDSLFPHAVAILAIAWGLRYIRVLVAEWLKERNASD